MDDLRFANYGQLRDVNANDDEMLFYGYVLDILHNAGFDVEPVDLVRKSDVYLTMTNKGAQSDFIRYKVTPRAKWFMFALSDSGSTKRRIDSIEAIKDHAAQVAEEYAKFLDFVKKYG